jgi:hypothetical protein
MELSIAPFSGLPDLPVYWRPVGWVLGILDASFAVLNWVGKTFRVSPKYFSAGWGNLKAVYQLQDEILQDLQAGKTQLLDIQNKLLWSKESSSSTVTIQQGVFTSPCSLLLPEESKLARFHLVTPVNQNNEQHQGQEQTYVIMLPATGEMGKSARLAMAKQLAHQYGWSSIIVTAPYYAARRPKGQRLFFLNYVSDVVLQSISISLESAAIARYLLHKSPNIRICFTGFSWGGAMTAVSSALTLLADPGHGDRIVAVPYVGSASPVCLADGVLETAMDWKGLHRDRPHVSEQTIRQALYDELNKTQLTTVTQYLGNGDRISHVNAVVSSDDRFIKSRYHREFVTQLQGLGKVVDTKVLVGGHITAALVRPTMQRNAIVKALLQKEKQQ